MRYGWLVLGVMLVVPALLPAEDRKKEKELSYATDVKPIVTDKCLNCHRGVKPKGNFNMESLASINKGGKKTKKPIVPGKPEQSLFYLVLTEEGKPHMPPRTSRKRPTEKEIETIRRWIADGAKE